MFVHILCERRQATTIAIAIATAAATVAEVRGGEKGKV